MSRFLEENLIPLMLILGLQGVLMFMDIATRGF